MGSSGSNDGPGVGPSDGVEEGEDGEVLCTGTGHDGVAGETGFDAVCKRSEVDSAVGIFNSLDMLSVAVESIGHSPELEAVGIEPTLGFAVVPEVYARPITSSSFWASISNPSHPFPNFASYSNPCLTASSNSPLSSPSVASVSSSIILRTLGSKPSRRCAYSRSTMMRSTY